ncbi:MAG: hypothetical protein ETSY2_21095 [Candidatus Entotheonella gemina]|uniref:PDZ domain-containing protein n=1 Tax=Candidatus Entotheonella gemina TaxID=1429439 RepID=W4M6E1_9BACT|nr:MAG: hypothetical protein ETSY2_21095 [Candidatus Entotheonella gemina]
MIGGRIGSMVLAWLLWLAVPMIVWAQPRLHHDLRVSLQPERHTLQVTDVITLPEQAPRRMTFQLHADLTLLSATAQQIPLEVETSPSSTGTTRYTLTLPAGSRTVTLTYRGTIFQPPQQRGATYARGFRETTGTITPEGVYLSAASFWYPQVADHLLTFRLDVQLPKDWEAVSQGKRTQHEHRGEFRHVQWQALQPQETIFLIAAPFTVYEQPAGAAQDIVAMAFLRKPDAALAHKYLETTDQYLAMYRDLIGPYPYSKFALVENFWETGYGMPSFTLLGTKVIRLPFILHSSYPHEMLHNWWGNGVYVDAKDGNWSEGLTAYLADHLIKAQRGTAVAYRRNTLQKYADYVSTEKDFPLTDFRSRHNPATEAVGYGKTLMLFHMLRQQIGDQAFIQGLQTFFQTFRFQRASFTDLLQTFNRVAGIEVQTFFDQWIRRAGAPELRIGETQLRKDSEQFKLTVELEQQQTGPPYTLRVPLAITLEGQAEAHRTLLDMVNTRQTVTIKLDHRPLRIDVDPQFGLFRRLHRDEIPPALSQLFGAAQAWIVLPSDAPDDVRQGYEQLAAQWQTPRIEVRWDRDLDALPTDGAIWLFGWENRWRSHMAQAVAPYQVTLAAGQADLAATVLTRTAHTAVLTARHPEAPGQTLGWLATDNPAAVPGLSRKLPHYGKYSYLGFSGDEPTNMAKGQWPILQSPMTVHLSQGAGQPAQVARAKLPSPPPLATLPPVFSAERMRRIVDFLASAARSGRGFGTPGLDETAAFIEDRFRQAGLQPGGDAPGSYTQTWRSRGGDPERQVTLQNVVGVIPGSKPEWHGQSVVVGAHYDHLGLGWPDAYQGNAGNIHPGADDNASGVAVLIELARRFTASGWQPQRTVIFVAFSGEEAGRLGSKHYVSAAKRWPAQKSIGMINFDTVGRLGSKPLQVLGTGSTYEWPHIFRGAGWVTGVPIQAIADDWGASDQRSFIEAGVPGVQLFSGAHPDIHRPTDTADRIDATGLVRVATVAREAIVYLAGRTEPLTSQLSPASVSSPGASTPAPASRRVRLGTIPDFAHAGPGYRIGDITPDSPAAAAGLQPGDVITRVNATPIDNARTFARVLRSLQPGDTINIAFTRRAQARTVQVSLTAR